MGKIAKSKNTHIDKIILSGALIIAIVSLGIAAYTLVRLDNYSKDATNNESRMNNATLRVGFCHDNQIIPCNDTMIHEWNSKHSDNTFGL